MDSVHISLLLFLSGGFVLCLTVRSVAGCKVSEASSEVQKNCQGYSPLCGNFFLAAYKYACEGRIRKRGNPGTFLSSYTVNPLYNEGPRDWQNLYAITGFCYIEVLFRIFYYCWGKKKKTFVTFVLPRTSLYISSLYRGSVVAWSFLGNSGSQIPAGWSTFRRYLRPLCALIVE